MCVYVCHACICTYICYALVSIYMHISIHAYGSICARTCMCIFFSENAQCALLTPAQSWRLPDGTVCQFSKEGKEKERYLCNNFEHRCQSGDAPWPRQCSVGTCGKFGMRRLLASLLLLEPHICQRHLYLSKVQKLCLDSALDLTIADVHINKRPERQAFAAVGGGRRLPVK